MAQIPHTLRDTIDLIDWCWPNIRTLNWHPTNNPTIGTAPQDAILIVLGENTERGHIGALVPTRDMNLLDLRDIISDTLASIDALLDSRDGDPDDGYACSAHEHTNDDVAATYRAHAAASDDAYTTSEFDAMQLADAFTDDDDFEIGFTPDPTLGLHEEDIPDWWPRDTDNGGDDR